jgi:hypothetical protein
MPSVYWISNKLGYDVDFVTHTQFSDLMGLIEKTNAPINKVHLLDYYCQIYDDNIFGSSIGSISESGLRELYPGYDKYYNACLTIVPPGHIAEHIAFKCGLIPSPHSEIINFTIKYEEDFGILDDYLVFHLGSSDKSRDVSIKEPDVRSDRFICVGGEDDPILPWMEDMRGLSLIDTGRIISGAKAVIGSDSFFTHFSAAIGVPTTCVHLNEFFYLLTNRRVYRNAHSVVCSEQEFNLDTLKMY